MAQAAPSLRVVKASLAAHLRNDPARPAQKDAVLERIQHAVEVQHWLSVHTMNIIKLWCVTRVAAGRARDLPKFTQGLVTSIMAKLHNNAPLPAHPDFEEVFDEYWKTIPLARQVALRDSANAPIPNVRNADATRIVTTLQNNILNGFAKCVRRYTKAIVPLTEGESQAAWKRRTSKAAGNVLNVLYVRTTVHQVTAGITDALESAAWRLVAANLPELRPVTHAMGMFLSATNAQCFLPAMMHMCQVLEVAGAGEGAYRHKPMAIFPMRTSMTPAYITLDYSAMVYLCYDLLPVHTPSRSRYKWLQPKEGVVQHQDELWGALFDTSKRVFRDSGKSVWRRGDSIQTDGIGLSVVRTTKKRNDGKRHRATPDEMAARAIVEAARKTERDAEMAARVAALEANLAMPKKKSKKRERADKAEQPTKRVRVATEPVRDPAVEIYATDLCEQERGALAGRTVIGMDPGKSDLFYASTFKPGEDEEPFRVANLETFRYTQASRKAVTAKNNAAQMSFLKQRGVAAHEARLNDVRKTTLDKDNLLAYFRLKNEVNEAVAPVYMDARIRKWRLGNYIAIQASEGCMLRDFEKKFGPKDSLVLAYGNWSATETFKGQVPTKGASLRRLFRRAGFMVLLIQEYYTSKRCCACKNGECSTFRTVAKNVMKIPRVKKRRRKPGVKTDSAMARVKLACGSGIQPLVECVVVEPVATRIAHGLVRCDNTSCARLWNRDVNGSVNILLAARAALAGEERPAHLKQKWTRTSSIKVFGGQQARTRLQEDRQCGEGEASEADPIL